MKDEKVSFIPHELTNLALVEEHENMACISDLKVDDLTGDGHNQVPPNFSLNPRYIQFMLQIQDLPSDVLDMGSLSLNWLFLNSQESQLESGQ